MLANSFCEGTRDDFKAILQRSMRRGDGQTLDVDLLLSCLQETLNFEHSLERRFSTEVRYGPIPRSDDFLTRSSRDLRWIRWRAKKIGPMVSTKPSPRRSSPT